MGIRIGMLSSMVGLGIVRISHNAIHLKFEIEQIDHSECKERLKCTNAGGINIDLVTGNLTSNERGSTQKVVE